MSSAMKPDSYDTGPSHFGWIAMTHNSFGRFYEVQSYGPDIVENLRLQPTVTSREWFRPNPPLPSIKWGPRNNTNIQESTLLLAMHQVAMNKELYLENYWMKNKRSVERGKTGPTFAWVIPATRGGGGYSECAAAAGPGNSQSRFELQSRRGRRCGGRLRYPRGSTVSDTGRHVLGCGYAQAKPAVFNPSPIR
jgi:hypothetical protein